MSVISATVYQLLDAAGNPRTEGWFLYEFTGTYNPGGEAVNLSSYMRRVEGMLMNPASGALNYIPFPNETDLPADARSGRAQLFFMGSGAVTVNTSGVNVTITSGQDQTLSGETAVWSGQMTAQVTAWDPNRAFAEVVSGVAISGTRARIFAMGY